MQPEMSHSIHVQQRLFALDHWVKGDDVELHQIVMNLIINACDAMSQGGTLIVETQTTVIDAEGDSQGTGLLFNQLTPSSE